MDSENNHSDPLNPQQQEEDEFRHLLIQSFVDNDTTIHSLWEERHQNYPVGPHEGVLQHDQNAVAHNAYNHQQLEYLHQQQEQNQILLQLYRNMMEYSPMDHPVVRGLDQEVQQNLVHQNTAVPGTNNPLELWYMMLHNTTNINSQPHQNHVPIQQFPQNEHNLLMPNNAEIIPQNSENVIQNLPPGYRFLPTDEELVNEYLKNKVENKPLPCNGIIHDVLIYDSNPYELIEQYDSFEGQWYFFTSRERKYPKGKRPRRSAVNGYWKPTGIDKTIFHDNLPIGYKLVLDFYEGKHQKGPRTDLKMHEYRIQLKSDAPFTGTKGNPGKLDKWVLCKIYRTRGGNDRDDNQEGGDQLMIDQENHDQPLNGADAGSSTMPILEDSALNSNDDNLNPQDNSRMINTDADKNTMPTLEESATNTSDDNVMQWDNGRMINTNADANIMPALEESAFNSSHDNLMKWDNAKMIKTDADANTTPTLEEYTLNSSNDNLMQQDKARMINIDADANTMPTLEESTLNSENTNNNNVMQKNNVSAINTPALEESDVLNIQNTSQSDFLNIPNGCKKESTSSQPDFWNILSGCEKVSTSTDNSGIPFDLEYFTNFHIEPPIPLDEHFFSDIEEESEQEPKKARQMA